MYLSEIGRQCKDVIESNKGLDFVLKQILANNFPLTPSRHAFEIVNGDIQHAVHLSHERITNLTDALENYESDEKKRKLLYQMSTIDVNPLAEQPIFLIGDEVDKKRLQFQKPTYDEKHKALSSLRPIGLVEYSTEEITFYPEINARISLMQNDKTELITELAYSLFEYGKYEVIVNDSRQTGQIHEVVTMSQKVIDNIRFTEASPLLFTYILQHAIRGV